MSKYLCLCLCILLMSSFVPTVMAEESYRFIIKPFEVDYAGDFIEGRAMIKKGGKWGFINNKGITVVEPKYDSVRNFKEGMAVVENDKKFGVIDKNGGEVVAPQYFSIQDFNEDFARFENSSSGLIDKLGNRVIEFEKGTSYGLSEGLVAFNTNSYSGYMDKTGEEVLTFPYMFTESFKGGVANVVADNKIGLIDKNGQEIIAPQYDVFTDFDEEGLAQVAKDRKLRFIDKTGQEIISTFPYQGSHGFSEGLAPVHKNQLWGYIDKTGEEVIPLQYDFAYKFMGGLARVAKKKDSGYLWGFINKEGKVVIPLQYSEHVFKYEVYKVNFSEGLEAVDKQGGESGITHAYIDKSGKEVLSFSHTNPVYEVFNFKNGLGRIQLSPGKWAYISNPLEAPADWAQPEVDKARSLGLVPEDILYGYNQSISRSDFSKLVVKLLTVKKGKPIDILLADNKKVVNKAVFIDTDDPAIQAANALELISGKSEGIFDPDGDITRQEAAVILARTAKFLGITHTPAIGTEFADTKDIASWAKDAVSMVSSAEDKTNRSTIMGSTVNNSFSPNATYTRQQAFISIKRLFHAL
ncbi:WG containing repeat-containing protein [Paenibacillus sp. 1_12]|uniref:WG repeat-containing protein n=1 Tax=Paenibacillus sp. 1_12 TaxID=1566278 RepID=UPI0008E8855A|nr:WG repeat-containing protein [Paenibacillus sp. 1_12]SFL86982.1 WG containing repeat-containing protein [Paenibacillus sp. 1_12]